MIKELYDAFRSVDIPEDKATSAVEKLAEQVHVKDAKLEFIKWGIMPRERLGRGGHYTVGHFAAAVIGGTLGLSCKN